MTDRYAGLHKIPPEPALRLLALANARLQAQPATPAAAQVPAVLADMEARGAWVDMLRLLSAALPPRECIWWGCLAAGDLLAAGAKPTRALKTARAWVFRPTDENRAAARRAAEEAEPDDDTALIASACAMCDGKLGPGELAAHDAPPGAMASMVFALNVQSLGRSEPAVFGAYCDMLIDRALDIARGGDGQAIPRPTVDRDTTEEESVE